MNKMIKSYLFTNIILYKTHYDKVEMENSLFPISSHHFSFKK